MKKDFFLLYDPSKSNLSISLIGQYFLISARFISEKSVLVVSLNPPRLMGHFVNSMLRSWGLPWERERERERESPHPAGWLIWSSSRPGNTIKSSRTFYSPLSTPRFDSNKKHQTRTSLTVVRWNYFQTSQISVKKKLILSESSQKLKKNNVECRT